MANTWQTRIVFYIGADMQDHPLWEAINHQADKLLAETFGGSTRQESRGSWRNDSGELEFEPSVRFEVLTDSAEALNQADKIAEGLRTIYRQREVLYSMDAVILRRTKFDGLARTAEGYLTLAHEPMGGKE